MCKQSLKNLAYGDIYSAKAYLKLKSTTKVYFR